MQRDILIKKLFKIKIEQKMFPVLNEAYAVQWKKRSTKKHLPKPLI